MAKKYLKERGVIVEFKVLKYYVFTCELIGVTPSFEGLEKFKRFWVQSKK